MAVTKTCDPNQAAVEVNKEAKQQLRYRIKEDPDVMFQLSDGQGGTLLSSEAPPRVRLWPTYPGEVPTTTDVTHTLGIQFGAPGEIQWQVELLAANGSVLSVVKDCRYQNVGGLEDHFDTLTIFIV